VPGAAHERAGQAAAQRDGDRPCDGVQEAGLSLAEPSGRASPPQVEESPAAEAVAMHRRGDVADCVVAQEVTPQRAARQVTARRPGQQRDVSGQRRPPVDRGEVSEADQLGQLRQARHVGQRSAANRGLRVGHQPCVGVEADHPADRFEQIKPQGSHLARGIADPQDPLAFPCVCH
jgi:hypothetical protein